MTEFDSRYYVIFAMAAAMVFLGILVVVITLNERRKAVQLETLEYLKKANTEVDHFRGALKELEAKYQSKIDEGLPDIELDDEGKALYGAVFTGSPVLDKLISYHRQKCAEQKISFDCRVERIPEAMFEERRLISLFGNLLENAYESACRCLSALQDGYAVQEPESSQNSSDAGSAKSLHSYAGPEQSPHPYGGSEQSRYSDAEPEQSLHPDAGSAKSLHSYGGSEQSHDPDADSVFIKMESRRIKDQWILIVMNSKLSSEEPLEHDLRSIKEDKANHGIGTLVVKKIVRDAKGMIDFQDKGNVFSVMIAAPVRGK